MTVSVPRTALRWDYAPAPESRDAARLAPRYDLFIGGDFVAPLDGEVVGTVNPATEETLAEVAFAGAADVARAVGAARRRRSRAGARCPRSSAASTCSASPG